MRTTLRPKILIRLFFVDALADIVLLDILSKGEVKENGMSNLSPKQARKIAKRLVKAAKAAEVWGK